MFAVCAVALLCLTSVSHSAPTDCKDALRPLDQLDPRHLEGRWALVAGSVKIIESPEPFKPSNSISIDFYNSTFTIANSRPGSKCLYFSRNISIEGGNYLYRLGPTGNFSGTLYHSSCQDCVVLSFKVESPDIKSEELCLFSKRREVDQREMQEFINQVACLNMPEHYVMDPTEELCPPLPRS